MTRTSDNDDIMRDLRIHTEPLCRHLLPGGIIVGHEYRCASVAGGRGKRANNGGSLAVQLKGSRRGLWQDFATRECGNLVDLVAANKRMARPAAWKWACDWLGYHRVGGQGRFTAQKLHRVKRAPPAKASPARDQKALLTQRMVWARILWDNAKPLAGTPGAAYLKSRGLTLPPPPDLRFAAALPHKPSGNVTPAIVAAVRGPNGRIDGVWRIWIQPDGSGKADFKPPRMGLGACLGNAVHLGPRRERIGVAEGIETALAVRQAIPDLTMWAGLSAPGVRALILANGVRRVLIFPDHDPAQERDGRTFRPGQDAARDLKNRLLKSGRAVTVVMVPIEGEDMNDLLRHELTDWARPPEDPEA